MLSLTSHTSPNAPAARPRAIRPGMERRVLAHAPSLYSIRKGWRLLQISMMRKQSANHSAAVSRRWSATSLAALRRGVAATLRPNGSPEGLRDLVREVRYMASRRCLGSVTVTRIPPVISLWYISLLHTPFRSDNDSESCGSVRYNTHLT
mgnify:CR=1 FL=1